MKLKKSVFDVNRQVSSALVLIYPRYQYAFLLHRKRKKRKRPKVSKISKVLFISFFHHSISFVCMFVYYTIVICHEHFRRGRVQD